MEKIKTKKTIKKKLSLFRILTAIAEKETNDREAQLALNEFMSRFQNYLENWAQQYTTQYNIKEEGVPNELILNTFMLAWNKIGDFVSDTNAKESQPILLAKVKTWLKTSLFNEFRSYKNKLKNMNLIPQDSISEFDEELYYDANEFEEDHPHKILIEGFIEKYLKKISPIYKDVFETYYRFKDKRGRLPEDVFKDLITRTGLNINYPRKIYDRTLKDLTITISEQLLKTENYEKYINEANS
jgi:DNA-directed RNA polymerase specialized sigma24 family protein